MQLNPDKISYAEKCSWYGVPVAEMDRDELLMMVAHLMVDLQNRREEEQRRLAQPIGQYL
jgi:hypothetical protein